MRRRWIADTFSPTSGHPTHAALTGEQANHLARVLRAEPGQIYDVVAAGFLHRAQVTAVSPEQVDFILLEELEASSDLPLHVYLSVFKFDHLEWAIEKATELGVQRITPLLARRTDKHLAQASLKRVERWRRIAHEASQQSRRVTVPIVDDPVSTTIAIAKDEASSRILLSETEASLTLLQALAGNVADAQELSQSIALAIGPEGGWAADEMDLFTTHPWTHVTLGPRILRAETAAIAAITLAIAHLDSRTK